MTAIHLTFDNGPHAEVTPRVLGALRRRGIRASFFVLGRALATPSGADLARRIVDDGHRIGNHSYSHETPLGDDTRPDAVALELGRTQDLLDAIAPGPTWFRPFGGGGIVGPHLLSPNAVDWLTARRATVLLWNVVPGDWIDEDTWTDTARRAIATEPAPVVVLHDILPRAMAHLDRFIGALRDAGHTFTLDSPASCLPIVDGRPTVDLTPLVRPHPPGDAR